MSIGSHLLIFVTLDAGADTLRERFPEEAA